MDHVCCRAVSSPENHHWEPFLKEDNIEEAEIDKNKPVENNPQLSKNPKAKKTNADTHQEGMKKLS